VTAINDSLIEPEIPIEKVPMYRPVLTKRVVRTKYFNFWEERVKWLGVLYILLMLSVIGWFG